jgi:Flp pilus assembly protein TadG
MKSRKKQSGQAAVESALVMLIFLPVLIGILDFGQFLYFHQSITERARAAARYGAVHTYTDGSDSVNVAIYNDPAGTANGAAALLPYLTATAGANGTVTATLSGATTDDARITVTISNYPYNFLSPFMSKATQLRTITATQPYEIGR